MVVNRFFSPVIRIQTERGHQLITGDDFASGLDASYVYDHPLTTMPAADRSHLGIFYPIMGHMCHLALVEVDPKTGKVAILDYVAVHDAGTVVNPMTLAGHIRGGTAQGIGTALYEKFHYDEAGQLVTGTFADYLIPTLAEMPAAIRVGHVETPSPFTEYGIKGGGEGGRMGAPGALSGAIEDALARVRRALRRAAAHAAQGAGAGAGGREAVARAG